MGFRSIEQRLSPLRDEAGFGLIEVVVSAVLVVIVSLGVYSGIDGAAQTSGINKHRSIATAIAQQDQDRMRAMTVNELSNYREKPSPPPVVGGVTYTVDSRADWVTDSTGSASCTSSSAQANYLRISSSVTWPGMRIPPVTVESIVAPPNGSFGSDQGSLAVQVRDRNGNPVQGAAVTLTGPKGYSDVTNASGCVLWGYLPAGASNAYTVTVSKAGYVDPSGAVLPSKQTGVVGEATTTLAFDYDLGGRIQGNYQTLNGSTVIAANGLSFMASHPSLTVPLGPFGNGTAATSYITGTKADGTLDPTSGLIYPQTVGYSVYAGTCDGAKPPSGATQTALVTPGATVAVALRMPPINMKVVNGTTTNPPPVNLANVKFTPTGSGCSTVVSKATGNNNTGLLTDPAMLYGTYTFCVSSGGKILKKTTTNATTLSNTTPTGIAVADATVNMKDATTGTC